MVAMKTSLNQICIRLNIKGCTLLIRVKCKSDRKCLCEDVTSLLKICSKLAIIVIELWHLVSEISAITRFLSFIKFESFVGSIILCYIIMLWTWWRLWKMPYNIICYNMLYVIICYMLWYVIINMMQILKNAI